MPNRRDRTRALAERSRFRMDDLQVQPDRLMVVRGEQEIRLELRMMEVLVILAEHAGEPLSPERLLIEVWEGTFYGDNPVSKTISMLRKLIGDDSRKPRYIETISKVGYRLIPKVSLPEDYRRMPSKPWTKGNPYVGLSAFDATHAAVFCGRTRIVADLLRAMRSQIENARHLVLIVGASGCGKTSLLRAGAIPLLTKPNGFDGLHSLSVANCDLAAAHGSDPSIPLVEALASWTLDGRPVFPPQTTEQLKSLIENSPEMIGSFVTEAFRCLTGHNQTERPYAHLLLTIDHAEALVANVDIVPEAREKFERTLLTVCACPHVLVTMVVRGDFYPKLSEALPALIELKAGDGHLDILTPRYGEIGQIIRRPAWMAEIGFETDPDTLTPLDDALRDATVAQPDALPLLQHTLYTLYENRNDQQQLTYAAYNAIGGIEGAIAHRAEQVYAALPESARARLNTVLARLIVIQPDSDAVSACRADLDVFDADGRALIDAFIAARLFVVGLHDGRPAVGVVHEALLRRWPRAAEWAQDNRRLLQAKARLQRAAIRWVEEGRQNDHLLNPGRPLAEAQEAARCLSGDFDGNQAEFLHASERMLKRRKRLRNGIVAALAALTFFSTTSAYVAIRAKNETEKTLDSLVKQADAFRTVGELVFRHANMRGAEPAFEIITETLRSAHENNPESEDILFQYAISSYWLGNLYFNGGKLPEAREQWTAYLEACMELIRISPNNDSWQKELSYAYNNIGIIDLREGKTQSALENMSTSLAIKKTLMTTRIADPGFIVEYADTLSWIGSTEESIASLQSAARRYDEQIRLLRTHISTASASDDHRRQFANALWRAARLAAATGNPDAARTYIQEAVTILSRLVDTHPRDDLLKKDFANALFESCKIHREQGEQEDGDRDLELAFQAIESIGMDANSPPVWLRLRETIRFHRALHDASDSSDAAMHKAISNLEALHASHPLQTQIAIDIANARIARGILSASRNRRLESVEDWKAASERIAPFAIRSKDHIVLHPWISANELLGNAQQVHTPKRMLIAAGYRDTPN